MLGLFWERPDAADADGRSVGGQLSLSGGSMHVRFVRRTCIQYNTKTNIIIVALTP